MLELYTAIGDFAADLRDTLCAGHMGLSSTAQRKINLSASKIIAAVEAHSKAYGDLAVGEAAERPTFMTETDFEARIERLKTEIDDAVQAFHADAGTAGEAKFEEFKSSLKLDELRSSILAEVAAIKPAALTGKPAVAPAAAAPAAPAPAAK